METSRQHIARAITEAGVTSRMAHEPYTTTNQQEGNMEVKSTELVPAGQVAEILLHGGVPEQVDAEAIQEDIVRRILAADTFQDAVRNMTTVPAKDLDGQKVTFHNVVWAPSSYEEGPGVYALLEFSRNGDDHHEVTSIGGRSVMALMLKAQLDGAYPFEGVLRFKRSGANPERGVWTFGLA